jgi:LL-diaminopimelate aminotransferase
VTLIDLGIGSPDRPTPPPIIEALQRAVAEPRNHGYPPVRGTPRFREAAARFLEHRFGVAIDADREVICVSGAEEGFTHLAMTFADDRSVTLVADIHYPIHTRATRLVGGGVHLLPVRADRGFLPDLGAIPEPVRRRARLLIVNYPHNPTGSVAPREFLEDAVAFCRAHGILLISDLAYSELTYDGYVVPSVLQIPEARDVAVEVHSLSKSFNMAGFRIAFVAGSAAAVGALAQLRASCTYGSPSALLDAAAFALDHADTLVPGVVEGYRQRRDVLLAGFRSLGWDVPTPRATMFLWLPVPAPFSSEAWAARLIEEAGVVVTPGNAFGPGGEGWFRVSLVAEPDVLEEAIRRLRRIGATATAAP